MPLAIVNSITGATSSANPNTDPNEVLKNILIELRVISSILLADVKSLHIEEDTAALRQDQVTEIPNPLI
jgi:hypothetical protein